MAPVNGCDCVTTAAPDTLAGMADPTEPSGKSPHAFMTEALGIQRRLVADRRAFVTQVLAAEQAALASNTGYRAADVDMYFEALAAEQAVERPRPHTWRK